MAIDGWQERGADETRRRRWGITPSILVSVFVHLVVVLSFLVAVLVQLLFVLVAELLAFGGPHPPRVAASEIQFATPFLPDRAEPLAGDIASAAVPHGADRGVPAARGPAEPSGPRNELAQAAGPNSAAATSLESAASIGDRIDDASARAGYGPTGRAPSLRQRLSSFGEALSQARGSADAARGGGQGTHVFVPDSVSLPGTGFGVGNLTFESMDYDWSDYARQIYVAIWRAWHNRLYQTTDDFERWAHQGSHWRLDHFAVVTFVIERSGEVTGIVLDREAGCPPLDASAIDALDEVILPPLPEDFRRDRETVHARFIAIGEVRGLRPTLTRLEELGYF